MSISRAHVQYSFEAWNRTTCPRAAGCDYAPGAWARSTCQGIAGRQTMGYRQRLVPDEVRRDQVQTTRGGAGLSTAIENASRPQRESIRGVARW